MKNEKKVINVTKNALSKLLSLKKLDVKNTCLRISVKQGGCSGMSYSMDFDSLTNITDTDEISDYGHFKIICGAKSLLYLYGMSLDYEDALVGGGFNFSNPNATQTCGCGKSFAA
uniref:hypothetical protein n=1 Tax=Ahnfeltia fastigiata TaxID=31363 RepID=UPI001D0FB0BE|nr:hypothetical protein LK038_pgp199 [Ahnfeltia fastigiata]UAT97653.1 hypothetical protein Ahn.fas.Ore.pt_011 [Ahnfeltia fastigiata]UAT97857.1 hypothetical protein Ahn.fas.Kor.pt_011 [Ahnfeltia fastigiata]